jgi:inhibitor of KinA sporulation pathway (predicted exonuclease)
MNKQTFDYFCVLDFEATCQESNKDYTMEIIEFPVVMIDTQPLLIESTFQMYVKPIINPTLSDYCTQLTGITQETVDSAYVFADVMGAFTSWISHFYATVPQSNILFITCGDWDLKTMLPNQCKMSKLSIPEIFNSWCNIKKMYNRHYSEKIRGMHFMKEIINGDYVHKKTSVRGMKSLLNRLNLPLIGRQHSGIDDARNIAQAVIKMCRDGCIFEPTWPKRDIGEELIEGLRSIARSEGKRYEVKID